MPLQDGGKIVVAWRVELVAGELFGSMVGAKRFTFTHPKRVSQSYGRTPGRLDRD